MYGRACWRLSAAAVLFALATTCGCAEQAPSAVDDKSFKNLQHIGAAYQQAAIKLNRPPQNASEITEFLQTAAGGGDPAEILRSPDDNENYVIVWGVDFSQVARTTGNVDFILAYEQRGKNGKRHVLKPPSIVTLLTDAEFQAARFPPGHQPAVAP